MNYIVRKTKEFKGKLSRLKNTKDMDLTDTLLFPQGEWFTLLFVFLVVALFASVAICCYCAPMTYNIEPVDLKNVQERESEERGKEKNL